MHITIGNIWVLKNKPQLEKHDYVISCLDEEESEHKLRTFDFPENIKGHNIGYFDDLDDLDPQRDEDKPQKEDIEALIAYIRSLPEDAKVLVHCTAGVGRSPACALGMLASVSKTPEEAFEVWRSIPNAVHLYWPNDRIIRLFDECLYPGRTPPPLSSALKAWKAEAKEVSEIWHW
jgi:predicted protein tyrosine phosphatase